MRFKTAAMHLLNHSRLEYVKGGMNYEETETAADDAA